MFLHLGEIHSRTTTRINDKQKAVLKQTFANEPHPSKEIFHKVSEQLGLKLTTVYNWFRHERERAKKAKHQLLPECKFIYVRQYCQHFHKILRVTTDLIN